MFNRLTQFVQKNRPSAQTAFLISVSLFTSQAMLSLLSEESCKYFKEVNPHYRCIESYIEKYVMTTIMTFSAALLALNLCKLGKALHGAFFQQPILPPMTQDENLINSLRKTAPAA